MIIFPAIDLRAGRVVRLQQGNVDAEKIYSADPARTAAQWQAEGAEWLHVVNLDGAFGDSAAENLRALQKIIAAVAIPAQFGGGLRDAASIDAAFDAGVARVVIGTAAIENPVLVSETLARYGAERVAVGIDARDGFVATRGWRAQSRVATLGLARAMRNLGITRIVHTDIARDGMLEGLDAVQIARLARDARVKIIASGGVAGVRDVEALRAVEGDGVEGVIIGQALYQGKLNLREAIDVGKANHPVP
ncbi:MAG: 1-(5-phosphoribosyl)-5-[(5-phosphoribosylamino)methylideneamino]imidazole-4-carboxamide isomerase [Chloroflexi bacterium]|nr:1-(5-phosphoribosyl)-5-[(5-phosphoribosylamino)methylideneamino]imidazole-4-carboxamide isomerase [Chloroflexota bacterium]